MPNAERIPVHLQTFLDQRIDSASMLEVLLALHREPARTWTSAELGQTLGLGEHVAIRHLAQLAGDGLVREDDGGFSYDGDSRDDEHITALGDLYARRPHTVIRAIFRP